MKNSLIITTLILSSIPGYTQNSTEIRNAILKMAGTYHVSFDFSETFSPDTAYKFSERYHSDAKEVVILTENSEKKISFRHFLLIDDTMVLKHWRQDWIYENREFLNYTGNNTWEKIRLSDDEVKGSWTQKVYQVDESPRYESYGKWIKTGEEWVWNSSLCNSPLPRRELKVRNDYSVMKRRSRIVIGSNYWYLEQDNQKWKSDTLICHEKGMEYFSTSKPDTLKINLWLENNRIVWDIIVEEWNRLLDKNEKFHLPGQLIATDYQKEVFRFVSELKTQNLNREKLTEEIRKFLKGKCLVTR